MEKRQFWKKFYVFVSGYFEFEALTHARGAVEKTPTRVEVKRKIAFVLGVISVQILMETIGRTSKGKVKYEKRCLGETLKGTPPFYKLVGIRNL